MNELLKLIDNLELDEIGAQEQFKDELGRYQRFNGVLGYTGEKLIQKPTIDLKVYVERKPRSKKFN